MPPPNALAVWAGNVKAGFLERGEEHVYAYLPGTRPGDAVSLTMPVRLKSWSSRALHPVFQMNLPEGALLTAIRNAVAKVAGTDDLTLLRITGGNQIGRNRYSLPDDPSPGFSSAPESLAEILAYPDAIELFNELMARHALHSGVSGIQPKVLLEATDRATAVSGGYIVKSWGADFPQLAANEYFCMTAARAAGLATPEFHLSSSGGLFVMKRFDVKEDGAPMGFEDLCALQALDTDRKYGGSYERAARTITEYVSPEFRIEARERFYGILVLSTLVRNGDAHLKNFGVLYDDTKGTVRLAPAYDIVTTTAYLKNDVPALTLNGRKIWWTRKVLESFALVHLGIPPPRAKAICEAVSEAVSDVKERIPPYCGEHPGFAEVGARMVRAWEDGLRDFMT